MSAMQIVHGSYNLNVQVPTLSYIPIIDLDRSLDKFRPRLFALGQKTLGLNLQYAA